MCPPPLTASDIITISEHFKSVIEDVFSKKLCVVLFSTFPHIAGICEQLKLFFLVHQSQRWLSPITNVTAAD